MLIFSLAARLNKTIDTILSMSEAEFFGWIAYFDLTKPET